MCEECRLLNIDVEVFGDAAEESEKACRDAQQMFDEAEAEHMGDLNRRDAAREQLEEHQEACGDHADFLAHQKAAAAGQTSLVGESA